MNIFNKRKNGSGSGLAIVALIIFILIFQGGLILSEKITAEKTILLQNEWLSNTLSTISGKTLYTENASGNVYTDDGEIFYRGISGLKYSENDYDYYFNSYDNGKTIKTSYSNPINSEPGLIEVEDRRYFYYDGGGNVETNPLFTTEGLKTILKVPVISRVSYIEYIDPADGLCKVDKSGYMIKLNGNGVGLNALSNTCY